MRWISGAPSPGPAKDSACRRVARTVGSGGDAATTGIGSETSRAGVFALYLAAWLLCASQQLPSCCGTPDYPILSGHLLFWHRDAVDCSGPRSSARVTRPTVCSSRERALPTLSAREHRARGRCVWVNAEGEDHAQDWLTDATPS
ncbi:hypothetical protein Q4I30_000244 [Leishmania utingensis]|uniref:Uncharacterized protein n=1 Tax=Leishmania utingensis TaxID=653362 RepID=A0AAW3B444_9TRYP